MINQRKHEIYVNDVHIGTVELRINEDGVGKSIYTMCDLDVDTFNKLFKSGKEMD